MARDPWFSKDSLPGWLFIIVDLLHWLWSVITTYNDIEDAEQLFREKGVAVLSFLTDYGWFVGTIWILAVAKWPESWWPRHKQNPSSEPAVQVRSSQLSKLTIHSAKYGNATDGYHDRTNEVTSAVQGDSLSLLIGKESLNDPLEGKPKELVVRYSFDGSEIREAVRPGSTRLLLPEDPWLLKQAEGSTRPQSPPCAPQFKTVKMQLGEYRELSDGLTGGLIPGTKIDLIGIPGDEESAVITVQAVGSVCYSQDVRHDTTEYPAKYTLPKSLIPSAGMVFTAQITEGVFDFWALWLKHVNLHDKSAEFGVCAISCFNNKHGS